MKNIDIYLCNNNGNFYNLMESCSNSLKNHVNELENFFDTKDNRNHSSQQQYPHNTLGPDLWPVNTYGRQSSGGMARGIWLVIVLRFYIFLVCSGYLAKASHSGPEKKHFGNKFHRVTCTYLKYQQVLRWQQHNHMQVDKYTRWYSCNCETPIRYSQPQC